MVASTATRNRMVCDAFILPLARERSTETDATSIAIVKKRSASVASHLRFDLGIGWRLSDV